MAESVLVNCQNASRFVDLNKLRFEQVSAEIIASSSQVHGKLETSSNDRIEAMESSNCNGACDSSQENSKIVHVAEEDLMLFEHQVSGHGTADKGLLKHKNGWILKPLQKAPMGIREMAFYHKIHGHEICDDKVENCYSQLKKFVPGFHGVAQLTGENNASNTNDKGASPKYLLLDDVLQGFKKPCVADVKLGARTWSPDASEAKIKQEMSKYKGTKVPLGICFTGGNYYDSKTSEKCKITKDFCKQLNPDTLKDTFGKFLNSSNEKAIPLVNLLISKCKELEAIIGVQKSFKLYGSSILVAYDADYLSDEFKGEIPLRVFMIDFAHFHTSEEDQNGPSLDENYLFGLRNFIKILCDIAAEQDRLKA